jgi:hypothetical protein
MGFFSWPKNDQGKKNRIVLSTTTISERFGGGLRLTNDYQQDLRCGMHSNLTIYVQS